MSKKPLAAIFGLSGPILTEAEKAFFKEVNPTGFILFQRNCETADQVSALVDTLRTLIDQPEAPILIDQEGGRVMRLKQPHWWEAPAAGRIADLWMLNQEAGWEAAWICSRLIGMQLQDHGITVNCAPVLDLRLEGAHHIIGDRSYGKKPDSVVSLAQAVCKGFLDSGVLPVIKHIPGHGRAMVDSHEALPKVACHRALLEAEDFEPFRQLSGMPWAMTAHIVYDAVDAQSPATMSSRLVQEIIRESIGFGGLLVTDDVSMKALTGDFERRARLSLEAGCDVVLHCNGDMAEMESTARGCAPLTAPAYARLTRGEAMRKEGKRMSAPLDRSEGEKRLKSLLSRL